MKGLTIFKESKLIGLISLFIAICILQCLVIFFELHLLYVGELYELQTGVGEHFAQRFLNSVYLASTIYPFYLLIRFLLIGIVIDCGFVLVNTASKPRFSKILFSLLVSYPILLLPQVIKIIYFKWIHPEDYLRSDFAQFAPISLINLFDKGQLQAGEWYLLQSVNLFDLSYPFFITLILRWISKDEFISFRPIVNSYYIAYFTGVVFIYFFHQSL